MTNIVAIPPAVKHAAEVLERIQKSIKNDSGAKADLKRALTGEPRHQRAAYPIVLRYLGETDAQYNLDQWLWVTGFLAYYEQAIDPANNMTFGDSARRLKDENSSGGTRETLPGIAGDIYRRFEIAPHVDGATNEIEEDCHQLPSAFS
jgi:hypothetical protein